MAGVESVVQLSVLNHISSSALVVGGITLLLYLIYQVLFQESRNYPPGPSGLPIFGNVLSLILTKRQQHEVVDEWSHKYGPIFAFKLLGTRVYILADPGLISEAFHQIPYINDRITFEMADDKTGRVNNGIAASNGEVWKEQRRFFLKVFKKIDSGVIRFEEIIGSEVDRLLKEIENKSNESFDPAIRINIAIANIITRIITGINYDHDDEEFKHLIECSHRIYKIIGPAGLFSIMPILAKLPSSAKTEIVSLSVEMLDVLRRSVETHKAEFDPDKPGTDFIGCYLKEMYKRKEENNPGTFDELNLLATSFDVLLGGFETSTTSISWMIFTLAVHPGIQERVRQEIVDVVGSDKSPRFSDRHSMPFTEATLAECMRLHPAVAIHVPHIASRDCKVGGYDVTKGSAVIANLWYLSRSGNLWKDPLEFKPERFLDAEGQFNKKLEPLPFGFGLRVCPGEHLARMEVFLFMTSLLQHFSLTLPEDAPTSIGGKHGLTNIPDPFKIHAKKI
ncbi:cytochrome P450 2J6-like [Lytechinus variegatus]|uniref:cytochrome P450 2J6-like n=1 Tax=Lytechinus variegatus TaxID=7654 RepID=UPI001BB14C99|nr:cytochrome P450 2J6-like [Lytechinus variegatus]